MNKMDTIFKLLTSTACVVYLINNRTPLVNLVKRLKEKFAVKQANKE